MWKVKCLTLRPLLPVLVLSCLGFAGCNNDTPQSLLISGKDLASKGENSAAVVQFKAALQLDPRLTEARVQLGRSLLANGDPASAALELSRALDEGVPVAEVAPALAKAWVLSGDFRKATSTLGALNLDNQQAQAELKSQMASAWGALGEREPTVAAINAALAAVPDHGPALVLRARVFAGQGKFAEATELLDRVVQLPVKLPEAWHLKGEIQEVAQNDLEGAAKSYAEALKIDPAYLPAHVGLINQKVRTRDLPAAKAHADQLRKLLPNHPTTVLVDAQLAFLARNLPLAREKAQTLMRSYPNNVGVLIVSGSIDAELGNLVVAETLFAKALQLNPDSWVARHNLADVYVRTGQPAKALEVLKPFLASANPRAEVLAMAGTAAIRLGDAAAAETYFQQAAKAAPGNTKVETAAAMTKFARGDAAGAFADLESLASQSADTYADEAIFSARLRRREFDAALSTLDAIAKKAPEKKGMMELRGLVHFARNDLAAARLAFQQGLDLDKSSISALSGLTDVDVAEGKYDQALQRLTASLAADPGNPFVSLAVAQLKIRMGSPLEELKKSLTEAIRVAPTDAQPRLLLTEQLIRARQFKEALVAAQDAATALPNDSRVLDAVGRAQMAAGEVEQAVTTYRRFAALDPNSAGPYIRLAEVFRTAGRRPQAEVALRKAVELNPDMIQAHVALVDLLVSSGQRSEALAYARKLQSDQPKRPHGYLVEGVFHSSIKAPDAAIAAYRNGVAKTNHSELAKALYLEYVSAGRKEEAAQFGARWMTGNPKDAAFEYVLAEQDMTLGDYAAAEVKLRRVVKAFPNNPRALNNLSWALSQQGKPGAVAPALRAVNLLPGNADVLDTLAAAQAAEGQPAQALKTQMRVVDLAPENHDLRLSLAKMALKVGDKATARAALKRLEELGTAYPKQAEVARLIQSL